MKTMNRIAVVALLIAIFSWRSTDFHIALEFVISSAAAFVIFEAARAGKHLWSLGFLLVLCLFNPVLPLRAPALVWTGLEVLSLGAFLFAMGFVKHSPQPAPVSVIHAGEGPEVLR